MFNRFAVSFVAITFALAGAASATDIRHKVEVPGDASKVWSQIGGWCAISDWHPVIAKCEESKDGNTMRRFAKKEEARPGECPLVGEVHAQRQRGRCQEGDGRDPQQRSRSDQNQGEVGGRALHRLDEHTRRTA